MRRFAPALGGRISRRNIALSPHLWSATGAMFAVFAIANLVLPFVLHGVDRPHLFALAAGLGTIAVVMLVARPPEPGSLAVHGVLATAYGGTAASMVAFAPHGSATIITGLFVGPLVSVWLRSRRAIATHLALSSIVIAGAAALTGDQGTQFAALCLVPASWALGCCVAVVLDAIEAQGREYERLSLRDALTGLGNQAFLDEELSVALTRHQSEGRPLALVELRLDDVARANAELGRAAGDGLLATVGAVLGVAAPRTAAVARTTGDRFAVTLPATDRAGAEAYAEVVRRRLAAVDAGSAPLATRVGIAVFPADGDTLATLQLSARAACDRDRAQTRTAPAHGASSGGLAIHLGEDPPLPYVAPAGTPAPEADEAAWSTSRVDRRGFARDRAIWRLTGSFFLFYAAVGALGMVIAPAMLRPGTAATAAFGAVVGVVILAARPAPIGSRANHAVIAAIWAMPLAAMAVCAPKASWVVGMAAFAGALIAVRLTARREILAHLLLFSGGLWALILSGRIDQPSVLAALILILCTWVLVACYVSVLEAAEAQGARMAELVLRDPLTGAGNSRLLGERLDDELPRHDTMQMPLVLLSLELCGYDDLRRHDGRGAAGDALGDIAVLLARAAGADGTVARIEGDRFRVLLPLTGPDELSGLLRDVRRAIAGTSRRARPLLPRIGVAAFPDDGSTARTLIAVAEARMLEDDPRAHDLTPAPDPFDEPLPVRRIIDRGHAVPSGTREHYAERRRSAG